MRHSPDAVSMLGQRRRRWINNETALGECLAIDGTNVLRHPLSLYPEMTKKIMHYSTIGLPTWALNVEITPFSRTGLPLHHRLAENYLIRFAPDCHPIGSDKISGESNHMTNCHGQSHRA